MPTLIIRTWYMTGWIHNITAYLIILRINIYIYNIYTAGIITIETHGQRRVGW